MSTTLRFSPAGFFGLPPLAGLFGKRASPAKSRPIEPSVDTSGLPSPGGTYPIPLAPGDREGLDFNRLLQAAKVAPDLALLEWDGDRARMAMAASLDVEDEPAASIADEDPRAFDPRRRKIRDRYISARFPGVVRGSGDLLGAASVVKSARLLFEEEQPDLALELLELAIEEAPHESALWLARLELLFLGRDRAGFVGTARAFRNVHPGHDAWSEVERLGRALAPDEPLFGATMGPREHEHYGPWPHLPNWIQAPWDLTAEIVAADFHRTVTRLGRPAAAASFGD